MAKAVTHQHIWKPAFIPGGVVSSTLCGRKSGIREAAADLNVGTRQEVTCKFCLSILRGDRRAYGMRFLGMSSEDVEAISQSRL